MLLLPQHITTAATPTLPSDSGCPIAVVCIGNNDGSTAQINLEIPPIPRVNTHAPIPEEIEEPLFSQGCDRDGLPACDDGMIDAGLYLLDEYNSKEI